MKILIISFILGLSAVFCPKPVMAQQDEVSLQIFYDELSPYGQWVDYPNWGYVWIPDVGTDFVPYSTAGHWVLTDYGWTWMSDFDWGWAPFHYGRWDFDDFYGWFWVPDTEWGPAWVTWRSSFGYYGWAPMEPGISIDVSFGRQYDRQHDHWIFVRERDIGKPDIDLYNVNRNVRNRIVINSTIITKTYMDNKRHTSYVSGPSREDVQRVTGRIFKPAVIQENDRPGQTLINGQLRIYRPQIIRDNERAQKPVPSRIIDMKDVRRPTERTQMNQVRNPNPNDKNRSGRQQNNSNPQNNNITVNPTQPLNSIPPANNGREQKPAVVIPQNYNTIVKPAQPQNSQPTITRPTINDRQQQPQRIINQQNKNPEQSVPQRTNPQQQLPTRTVTPQTNPVPTVQQKQNPLTNEKRPLQPTTVAPQQNNVKPTQPQNTNPKGDNKREQRPKNVKPSDDTKKDVRVQSGSEEKK